MNRDEALAIVSRSPAFGGTSAGVCQHCGTGKIIHYRGCLYASAERLLLSKFATTQDKENFAASSMRTGFYSKFSIRVARVLKDMEIESLSELRSVSPERLLAQKNFGRHSMREIEAALAQSIPE